MKTLKFILASAFLAFGLTATINARAQSSGMGGKLFVQEYMYDFAKHGGAVGFISLKNFGANALPSTAVVTSAHYTVLTAFTSGGSATVAIGDAASGARYRSALAFDNAAYTADTPAAIASGVPVAVASANIANVGITVATAALTAGKMRIVIQGYVPKGQ